MVLRDSFCWNGQVQEQDQDYHSHQRECERYPGHQSVDRVYHWRQQWWCSCDRWRLFKGCVPALVHCCTRLSVGMMLRHKEPMWDMGNQLFLQQKKGYMLMSCTAMKVVFPKTPDEQKYSFSRKIQSFSSQSGWAMSRWRWLSVVKHDLPSEKYVQISNNISL